MSLLPRLLLLVVLAIAPALAFQVQGEIQARREGRELVREEALRLARLVSLEHRNIATAAEQLLTALGTSPLLRALDEPGCNAQARELIAAFPRYTNLSAATLEGRVLCSAHPAGMGRDVSARPWFVDALRERRFVTGEFTPGGGSGRPGLPLAQPWRDAAGRVAGVVVAAVDLAWLSGQFARYALPPGASAVLLDRHGTVLASLAQPRLVAGQPAPPGLSALLAEESGGTTFLAGADGVTRLTGFASLSEDPAGLLVAVGLDPSRLAELGHANRLSALLIAGGALLALLVMAAGMRRLVHAPVGALLAAAESWGRGGLSARVGDAARRGGAEFRRLATAFDAMAGSLAAREAALRRSEAFRQSILDGTSDCMAVLDAENRIAFLNEPGCRQREIEDGASIIGHDVFELWPEEAAPRLRTALAEARAGRTGRFTAFGPTAKGTPKWWDVTITRLPASGDEPPRLLSVSRDVTRKRRALDAAARFRSFSDRSGDAHHMLDAEGRIVYANPAAWTRLGYTEAEFGALTLAEFDPDWPQDRYRALLERALAGPVPPFESRHRRRDGTMLPVEVGVSAIMSEDGPLLLAIVRDIGERRRAQDRLAEAEARWRGLLERLHEGVALCEMVHDADGEAVDFRYLEVNGGWERITGIPAGAARGRLASEVIPGIERAWVEIYDTLVRTGEARNFEMEVAALGSVLECNAFPLGGARFGVSFLDVTARRAAERARAESEARFRAMADNSPALIWVTDADGQCTYLSRPWRDFTGQPEAEGLGLGWLAMVHPEDRESARAAFLAASSRREPYRVEIRLRHAANRGWAWVIDAAEPRFAEDGTYLGFIGSALDITERREAEAALARSNAEARAAAERVQLALAAGAIVGTWDWDLTTDRFTVDERFAESFGIDPALGRSGLSLAQVVATVHPDDLGGLREAIAAAIARGGAYSHDYRVRGRDGAYRWIQANGRVDHGPDGTPLRFPGVLIDVEARRALEAERDRATGLLRAFADAVPGVVYAKDRAGRMLVANRGATALIGKPPEFYLGRTDLEFLDDKEEARAVMATDQRIMESGEAEQVEEAVSLPDGTSAIWLSNKAPFRDPEGRVIGIIGASVDITARKQAETVLARSHEDLERLVEARTSALRASEQRLTEAARMEALGRLAGGIAHDFNNVLQSIQGGLSLARKRMGRDIGAATRFLDLAEESVGRGTAVTNRLLSFARRGELAPAAIEPGPLLEGIAHLLRHTLGPAVTLRAEVMPGTPALLADAGQLEAVLVNLANNARDALRDGQGTIVLEAAPAEGNQVRLAVRDDGNGMTAEVLRRVTEPFFTTKPKGQGTGLGLAMARGFAEQSGGTLRIRSEAGRGTTVALLLPRAAPGAVPASPPVAVAEPPPSLAPVSVLVVDDEPAVRTTLAAALAERGHAAAEAEDATAALRQLDGGARPDVIVTDLSMPGLDGLALIREVRRRRPGLPAVLVTGHVGDAGRVALEQAAGDGPFLVLRKPVAPEAMERQLAVLLHGRDAAAAG